MEPTAPTPGLVFRPLVGAGVDAARPRRRRRGGSRAAATAGAAAQCAAPLISDLTACSSRRPGTSALLRQRGVLLNYLYLRAG